MMSSMICVVGTSIVWATHRSLPWSSAPGVGDAVRPPNASKKGKGFHFTSIELWCVQPVTKRSHDRVEFVGWAWWAT